MKIFGICIIILTYCFKINQSETKKISSPSDALDVAFESHQKGDFENAVLNYLIAIKGYEKTKKSSLDGEKLSHLCTALHNLGFILHYEKRKHKEAIKYFRRATHLRPAYFEAYHHLGQVDGFCSFGCMVLPLENRNEG